MTKDKHDFEELTAPAATAKELKISVPTLRKYSLIVEKVTGKPDYYERTKQKARLYSKKDLQDLKDFHKLAQDNGLTLQEAAQQIFAVSDKKDKTKKVAQTKAEQEKQEVMSPSQMAKLLTALQQTIVQQNSALDKLQKQLNRIEKQNKDLLAKQKELGQKDSDESAFAGLPDISGIITDDETDLLDQADPDIDKPLTAAEKRAQVVDDGQKSSEEVHEEILAKAKENAEKSANNSGLRTLTDMQVEPKKAHWWQKFLDI